MRRSAPTIASRFSTTATCAASGRRPRHSTSTFHSTTTRFEDGSRTRWQWRTGCLNVCPSGTRAAAERDASRYERAREPLNEAYIRILLTRGVGELSYDVKATPAPSLIIIVKPFDEPPARMFDEGIKISLVSVLRNHPGSVNPIIKSNNLLNNAIAMQEAHRKGGDEALMCNYRGELSECSQSNFFLVRDGVALTPRSASGLLEGLTRGFLFEVGREVGVAVEEATLRPDDLATAQEAFITGSTRELTPVVRIDDQVIGTGRPGPVTRALLAGFRKKAWEMSAPAAAAR